MGCDFFSTGVSFNGLVMVTHHQPIHLVAAATPLMSCGRGGNEAPNNGPLHGTQHGSGAKNWGHNGTMSMDWFF